MDDVITIVKSVIIIEKGGISVDALNRNYRAIESQNIPYRQYGFKSLNDFLETIPNIRIFNRAGTLYVKLLPTERTMHIADMINKQRTKPKGKKAPLNKPRRITSQSAAQPLYKHPNFAYNNRADSRQNYQYNRSFSTPSSNVSQFNRPPSVSSRSSSKYSVNTDNAGRQLSSSSNNRQYSTGNNNNNNQPSFHSNTSNNSNVGNTCSAYMTPSERLARASAAPANENVNTERRVVFAPIPKVRSIPPLMSIPTAPTPSNNTNNINININNNNNNNDSFSIKNNNNISKCTSPPKSPKRSGDPRDELAYLAEKMHLPKPVYKTKSMRNEYYCKVYIGKYDGLSQGPYGAKSVEEAEKLSAKDALEKLTKQIEDMKLQVTDDKELIKQRLLEILNIHKNGIFVQHLHIYYEDKYNEELPNDWRSIAEYCLEIAFDNGVANSTILVLCNPIASQIYTAQTAGTAVMKKLILPNDTDWFVYIKNFVNIDEIWGIIIDEAYSDKDYALSIEMSRYYEIHNECAKSIEIDHYYALQADNIFHRVRVIAIEPTTHKAEVFFIDFGDYEVVTYDKLLVLDKRFYDLAPQAIKFSLSDLQELADIEGINSVASSFLQDHSLVCRVTDRQEYDNVVSIIGVFYDTNYDEQLDINKEVGTQVVKHLEIPLFFKEDEDYDVSISNVDNTNIYMHVNNKNIKLMNFLLKKLCTSYSITSVNINNIDNSQIYLVQYPKHQWARCKVLECSDNNVTLLLVDYGNTITINCTQLCQMPQPIGRYPELAYKIKLHNIEQLTANRVMIERLRELAPPTVSLKCKIINIQNSIPVVAVWKISGPENVLISINDTLVFSANTKDDDNNNRPKKRLDRNNRIISRDGGLGLLDKPMIPDVNKHFDVHVTELVSNPSHFIVQPYVSTGLLTEMMKQLDQYCKNYRGPQLPESSLTPGTICAIKWEGVWQRAYIMHTYVEKVVVVYLCDTGAMATSPYDEVLPLDKLFLELPYQAIKAKLYGIKPVTIHDWTTLECTRFKELVANKDFVSVVHNIERDENQATKLIITIELIDTSTETDIKIHEVLVNEVRAERLTSTNN